MIYNLLSSEKETLIKVLNTAGIYYDQFGFKSQEELYKLKEKIKRCSTVQLITDGKKRTFADEA